MNLKLPFDTKPIIGIVFAGMFMLVIFQVQFRTIPNPSATELQSSKNEQCLCNIPKHPPTRAVIHMGVHKTSSTSIQTQSKQKAEFLNLDGYEMPWSKERVNRKEGMQLSEDQLKLSKHQVNFATCFMSPSDQRRKTVPCDPDLLLQGSDIAKRKRNLFVSAEIFSRIEAEGVYKLSSYLSQWDEVIIIIYYRRFHSYIASLYDQITKERSLTDVRRWELSPTDFIINELLHERNVEKHYTFEVVQRLKEQFHNIVVMNFHNEPGDEPFYCHALPNATHACEAIRADRKSVHENSRVDLDYADLAYGAMKAGLVQIESDERMSQVAKAAQNYQEKTLQSNSSTFKRVCLLPEVLEKIWYLSLQSELVFFPDQVYSTSNDLRSDFENAARTTLCKVDVNKTLEDHVWQIFFKSL